MMIKMKQNFGKYVAKEVYYAKPASIVLYSGQASLTRDLRNKEAKIVTSHNIHIQYLTEMGNQDGVLHSVTNIRL